MDIVIVGLGEILWDIFPDQRVLGGAPANFAYHVSQFGYSGYAVSAVGNDNFGNDILELCNRKGLKHLIEITPYPTGTVDVTLDSEGIPQYEIIQNVAWDNIPFTDKTKELARKTKAVSFGSLAQRSHTTEDTINKFLDTMPADSLKIFDINLRQHYYSKEILHNSLNKANILKINEDEIIIVSALFGIDIDEQSACLWLINNYNLDMLILTKGINGSFIFTCNEVSFLPTPKVQVVDTVGAGDAFTAAFVASHLYGNPVSESHRFAVDVSAYVCTQQGAMPELPEYLTNLDF